MPEGLDAAAVSEADLGVLRLGGLPFGSLVPAPEPSSPSAGTNDRANAGSNAWTISPARSATGRPILANDPHLGIGSFGPRHVAHLSAPGLDVIGGGSPGLPGIMQGHTDRFAFGRTNFHIDQEDLFVLELHPDDPERYRHGDGWRRFERVEVSIPVKGAAAARRDPALCRAGAGGLARSRAAPRHRARRDRAAAGRERRVRDDRDQPGAGLGEPARGRLPLPSLADQLPLCRRGREPWLAGDRLRAGPPRAATA